MFCHRINLNRSTLMSCNWCSAQMAFQKSRAAIEFRLPELKTDYKSVSCNAFGLNWNFSIYEWQMIASAVGWERVFRSPFSFIANRMERRFYTFICAVEMRTLVHQPYHSTLNVIRRVSNEWISVNYSVCCLCLFWFRCQNVVVTVKSFIEWENHSFVYFFVVVM